MLRFLLWLILKTVSKCLWRLWSLWRFRYAIRLSLCSQSETVEPNNCIKPTKPTTKKHAKETIQQSRKLLRKKRDAMYNCKGQPTPEVNLEADTECKAFRMKQQQEVLERQALLSSHLVQLVWYRAYVEALIHVQMLSLPPPPPLLPAKSHVQFDPPEPILPV